jgi:hypothetical protein
MPKKIIKTKNQKSKNQVATKENDVIKKMDDDLKTELGLKSTVELCYKSDKDGIRQIHFKNFEEKKTNEEVKEIINDFYGAFGVKNALIADILLHNAMMVSSNSIEHNERELNFAYSFLKEIKPQDTLEAMLAVQMLGTHLLSCKTLYRANLKDQTCEGVNENVNRATKLSRTFIAQMEALKKHRSKGDQKITVEHINVNDGGKVSIGETNTQINNHLQELIDGGVGTK